MAHVVSSTNKYVSNIRKKSISLSNINGVNWEDDSKAQIKLVTLFCVSSIWRQCRQLNGYDYEIQTCLTSNFIFFRFWVAPDSYNQIDYRIQKFLFLYACTNSCANPLIYGAFSTNGAGIFTNKDRAPASRRWVIFLINSIEGKRFKCFLRRSCFFRIIIMLIYITHKKKNIKKII